MFYGKVAKLLDENPSTHCTECKGEKNGKPMMGLVIIEDMKPYRNYWSYGTILDPETGKVYKCNISLESADKLKVRGYIGISALGRSQIWHRVK